MIMKNHGDNAKLSLTDTESFIVHIQPEDVYADFAGDFEMRFDTSNYAVDRPLPIRETKKVIGLKAEELNGKIMK